MVMKGMTVKFMYTENDDENDDNDSHDDDDDNNEYEDKDEGVCW